MAVEGAVTDIARRRSDPTATVQATNVQLIDRTAPLAISTMRFAPPSYRASATVSNCRADRAYSGDPGIPVIGLPDCTYVMPKQVHRGAARRPRASPSGTLRAAGVPVPDNYGFPSYIALQETAHVTLQAIRLGQVAFTVCPCEMFAEQGRNIRSRLDRTEGNLWFGFDWTANYRFNPGWEAGVAYVGDLLPDRQARRRGTPRAGPARHGARRLPATSSGAGPTTAAGPDPLDLQGPADPHRPGVGRPAVLAGLAGPGAHLTRIASCAGRRGCTTTPAAGTPTSAATGPSTRSQAESEPTDPARIWGNWTQEELTGSGYDLVVTVSMTNDYWGYIPTYREWQARDFYRKALAGLGPHSSDFFATRLTRMAAALNGGPAVALNPKDIGYGPDATARPRRRRPSATSPRPAMPTYEAGAAAGRRPGGCRGDQAGRRRALRGRVLHLGRRVELHRRAACAGRAAGPGHGAWLPFGDGYGEVQVKAGMPTEADLPAVAAGQFLWKWTATFEAYDSDLPHTFADRVTRTQVPEGTYRFVVDGCHRGVVPTGAAAPGCSPWDASGRVAAYRSESAPFAVRPWSGLTVSAPEASADWSTVTVDVGPNLSWPASASNTARSSYLSAAGTIDRSARSYTQGMFDYPSADAVDYPDTVAGSPFRYVRGAKPSMLSYPDGTERFCFQCTFETWADSGAVQSVTLSVLRAGATSPELLAARFDPASGRWSAPADLRPGDQVLVAARGVRDMFGEGNGAASATLTRPLVG